MKLSEWREALRGIGFLPTADASGEGTAGRHVIWVARDFSATPAGRVAEDGEDNATRFREKFLVPSLESGGITVVALDGVAWCAASFVEEAFGKLVTMHGFEPADLHERLEFVPGPAGVHEQTPELAFEYIDAAKAG